jgi:tripartite motif-containing protein 71
MPRFFRAALLAALIGLPAVPAPAARAAACPGAADPCPYSAVGVVGRRAEGVMRFPQAVAVGPDGSLYVADQYTHAIQVFGPDGTYRRELGAAGSGPGGLSSVGAVAVAADGSVYVADGSDRIDRFAADGRLLDSWGGSGTAPGEFHFGTGGANYSGAGGGIAVADGMVYVADTRNDRIQRFAADGTQATVIVPKGRLSRPQGLTVHGSRLVVADDDHHRLAVFDTGGHFIRTVGSGPGPQPGQLQNPYDVASDADGRLYVADNVNHRVVRYGPASAYDYRARWGSFGSAAGQLQYPRGIAADAQGDSYVADPGNNRVDVFDIGGDPLTSIGTSGRISGQFIVPLGVAADAGGTRAVADSIVGRVQLLNPDGSVAAEFGSPNPGPTVLPDPVAVAFDGAGNAYVLDQQRGRVLVFDRAGTIVRTLGSRGSGAGKLLAPSAIALDAAGTVYVADTGNGRIARWSAGGTYLGAFASFNAIRGIAVTPDGSRVYAADAGTNHIYVLSGTGEDLAQMGGGGSKPGKLRSPAQLTLDGAGNVWVADRNNDRVEAFSPAGVFLGGFGQHGTAAGQFIRPTGVAFDCHGVLTVGDSDNNRVQQFTIAAPTACAALPPVKSPPAPKLPTQPAPVAPRLSVTPSHVHALFTGRALPLRVRCDVPCTISISARVTARAARKHHAKPTATLRFAAVSIPAASARTLSPKLAAADVRRLRKALHGRRGLVADVQVTASTSHSAPTLVTKRYDVTG